MSSKEAPSIAFILSLIGGMLILLSGVMFSIWFMSGGHNPWGMMGGDWSMMGNWAFPFGFMSGFSLIALVAGIIVVIGAVMLNARPSEHMAWGVIILIFSIISLLGMG